MNEQVESTTKLRAEIKKTEGLSLRAYRCPRGKLTIGYGHTQGVRAGQTITLIEAEELLTEDIRAAERDVRRLVTVPLTKGKMDALTDFVFNLGAEKLRTSTLLRVINRGGSVAEVRNELMRWVYCNGERLDGLVKRRTWEYERWISM